MRSAEPRSRDRPDEGDACDEVQIFRLGEVSDQLGSGTLVIVASQRLRRGIGRRSGTPHARPRVSIGLRVPRRRPIALGQVARRAEMRAALEHLPGDRRTFGLAAVLLAPAPWVLGRATAGRRRPRLPASTTSPPSTPRCCRSCRAGRSRWADRAPTGEVLAQPSSKGCSGAGTRPARCWPCGGRPAGRCRPRRTRSRQGRRAPPAPTRLRCRDFHPAQAA